MTPTPSTPAADAIAVAQEIRRRRARRKRLALRVLLAVVVTVALVWGLYWLLDARWYEGTDDAYVNGNVVAITPQLSGTVIRIDADDNDFVARGQTLVQLDPADADVALAKARAALGQAVRRVRGLYSASHGSGAEVAVREAALNRARADFRRRQGLAASGAISSEELAHARDALAAAESALAAAQASQISAEALVADTEIATHPDVLAAAAALRAAWLDDQRTRLPAPLAGYVAKRSVQLGQRVQPGTPLMAVIPLDQVWVDANFKETQLRHMRIGQSVTLSSDLYGDAVRYHGRVIGLGIGTGSAFSLLPAQNASGNWIKIVQRLPVRIRLDPAELSRHPLRIGLSMNVRVDLHQQSGPMLAPHPAGAGTAMHTDVYTSDVAALEALIAEIIRANSDTAPNPALEPEPAVTR